MLSVMSMATHPRLMPATSVERAHKQRYFSSGDENQM
jgi:hypothetical protein